MMNKLEYTDMDNIDELVKQNNIMILKFDKENSKYDEYIYNMNNIKVINITDEEIMEFYDVNVVPTLLIYKNKNLIDSIEGFLTKTDLIKKLLRLI